MYFSFLFIFCNREIVFIEICGRCKSLDSLYSQAIPVNFHKGDALNKKMSSLLFICLLQNEIKKIFKLAVVCFLFRPLWPGASLADLQSWSLDP